MSYDDRVKQAIQRLRDAGDDKSAAMSAWEEIGQVWEDDYRDGELSDTLRDAFEKADPHFASRSTDKWKVGRDIILKAAGPPPSRSVKPPEPAGPPPSRSVKPTEPAGPPPSRFVTGLRARIAESRVGQGRNKKKSRKTKKTQKNKRRMTRRQ